jgi:hypothetical protein
MIKHSDITVVFCGGYTAVPRSEEEAKKNQESGKHDFLSILLKTKDALPEAEFILSTDTGTIVDDEVKNELSNIIYSDSPPSLTIPIDIYPRTTKGFGYNWHLKKDSLKLNYNKMIISAKRGIKAATRKYVLRLRTDTLIQNPEFIQLFEDYQNHRDSNFKILTNRILVSSLFTIDSRKWNCYLHHPSDWLHFGLKEDVVAVWDIPLGQKITKIEDPNFKKSIDTRTIPEAYTWMSLLMKKRPQIFKNYVRAFSDAEINESHKYLYNNFIPIDSSPINYYSVKKGASWLSHNSLYTFAAFLKDYYYGV